MVVGRRALARALRRADGERALFVNPNWAGGARSSSVGRRARARRESEAAGRRAFFFGGTESARHPAIRQCADARL